MRNTLVISVSVNKKVGDAFLKYCKDNCVSRSQQISALLEEYLKSKGVKVKFVE